MIKIKLGPKEKAPPPVEAQIPQFAKELKDRWSSNIKAVFEAWLEVTEPTTKALNPYPVVGTAISILAKSIEPSADITAEIVKKYIGGSFAYGVAMADKGDETITAPPSGKDAEELANSVGFEDQRAVQFTLASAFNEVTTKDAEVMGMFRRRLIESLEGRDSPYKAASDIQRDLDQYNNGWSTIARTEMSRALSKGSFDRTKELGVSDVYIPRTNSSCPSCSRLIEGRVFRLETIEGASNYGQKQNNWVAALPLHPN